MGVTGEKSSHEERISPPRPVALPAADREDEIRLVDLLLAIGERSRLFWAVFLGVVAVALLGWYFLPETYRFRTTVELGTAVAGEQMRLLEPAPAALAKLENSWIPTYQERLADPGDLKLRFKAFIPRGSALLVLETKGKPEEAPTHREAHAAVLRPLLAEHQRLEEIVRLRLGSKLASERARLQELIGERGVSSTRFKNLAEEKRLLEQEARELRQDITEARKQWQESVEGVEDETRAVILMLLESDLRKSRARLEQVEKQLYVDLPNSRAELEHELEDGKRLEEQQATVIAAVEGELSNLLGSRMVGQAVRSLRPTGLSGTSLPVAVFLALVGGSVLALAAVFGARLRSELRSLG